MLMVRSGPTPFHTESEIEFMCSHNVLCNIQVSFALWNNFSGSEPENVPLPHYLKLIIGGAVHLTLQIRS